MRGHAVGCGDEVSLECGTSPARPVLRRGTSRCLHLKQASGKGQSIKRIRGMSRDPGRILDQVGLKFDHRLSFVEQPSPWTTGIQNALFISHYTSL